MALIACKLCGKSVSSRALACPKCGCPNILRTAQQPAAAPRKNCVDCEYFGMDSSFACNLCELQGEPPKSSNLRSHSQITAAEQSQLQQGTPPSDLLAQISALEIDPHLQELFTLIAATPISANLLGIRRFEVDIPQLRHFRTLRTTGVIDSSQALLMGGFYYILHGIWRKGVLVIVLQLGLLAALLFCIVPVQIAAVIGLALLQLIVFASAKYDRYRQLVLEEVFWW